jgi:type II secretory pathway pseudopilin PulG
MKHRASTNPERLRRARPTGIVLLAFLITLALLGIGLLGAVDVWALARQRDRETELLFVGDQYRRAIARYYLAAPRTSGRTLPPSIDKLLEDDRYPIPVRHLRRAYPDPITGKPEWGLTKVGDQIIGVYSLSEAQPLKVAGFPVNYSQFEGAKAYRDWVFSYRLPRGAALPPAAAASSPARPASSPVTPSRRSPT